MVLGRNGAGAGFYGAGRGCVGLGAGKCELGSQDKAYWVRITGDVAVLCEVGSLKKSFQVKDSYEGISTRRIPCIFRI